MKISICTTTAREGFIEWQAKLLSTQTHTDIEWVLVDFAYERNALKMKKCGEELGLSIKHVPNVRDDQMFFRDITRNRNKALAIATGDAVIFLDDYALIPNDFVANHVEFLERGMVSAGLMHRMDIPDGTAFIESVLENEVWRNGTEDGFVPNVLSGYDTGKDYRDKNGEPYLAVGITYTGNLGIPRTVFEKINGFDSRMESGLEDCDFGARASTAGFKSVYNPHAWTINLDTGNHPYVYSFDHAHDVEPFISNPNNQYRGDDKLPENEFIKVEFHEQYRIAHCKICGAHGMIDPNELLNYNVNARIFEAPKDLPGGYDTLLKNREV